MLTRDDVAAIKASQGVYRATDVARNYDVHPSTIQRIWQGRIHTDVSPASDFPDIRVRYYPRDMAEDIAILLARGMKPKDIAQQLNISVSIVWQYKGIWL